MVLLKTCHKNTFDFYSLFLKLYYLTWKLFFMKIGVHFSLLNKNFINIQCSTNYILKHDSNLSLSLLIFIPVCLLRQQNIHVGAILISSHEITRKKFKITFQISSIKGLFPQCCYVSFFKVSIASYLKSYMYSTIFCKKKCEKCWERMTAGQNIKV